VIFVFFGGEIDIYEQFCMKYMKSSYSEKELILDLLC